MDHARNPFPPGDPDRHAIWNMLVARDIDAFVAADWSMVAGDFVRDGFRQLRHPRLHGGGELLEPLGAVFDRHATPRLEPPPRGRDGPVDVVRGAAGHPRDFGFSG